MNKLVTCASLAAVGAVGLQAQYLGTEGPQKSWSVSAHLRGFFDDNYATLPGHLDGGDWAINPATGRLEKRGPTKRGSWGGVVGVAGNYSPKLGELTTAGVNARYDMYYYEDRDRTDNHPIDQNLQVGAQFSHQFTELYKVDVHDAFVIAQEPNLLEPGPLAATWLRSEGSNRRNNGGITASARLAPKLTVQGSYNNIYYDYQQQDDASRSALLDKMVHSIGSQVRYDLRPNTTGYLGYRFDYTDMTSKDRLWSFAQVRDYLGRWAALGNPADPNYAADNNLVTALRAATTNPAPTSSIRDNSAHFVYLGLDNQFNAYLSAQAMVGGQYTEFPNARERVYPTVAGQPTGYRVHAKETFGPYANVNLRYDYAKNCLLQLGFIHARNSTDVAQIGEPYDEASLISRLLGESTTLDQESTTAYGSIIQAVGPKVRLNLRAQWQGSLFNQKGITGVEDNYVAVDVKADYQFNKYLFAEAGYGFDLLVSDLPNRGFARNRLFIGVRGTY